MVQPSQPVADPRYHTARIHQMLTELAQHARDDVQQVNEPRARALFETTAEVLEGLARAYTHYDDGSEPAWRAGE